MLGHEKKFGEILYLYVQLYPHFISVDSVSIILIMFILSTFVFYKEQIYRFLT
jgi:hypothetical protein